MQAIVAFLHTDMPKASFQGKNVGFNVPDPKAHNELEIRPNFSTQIAKLQNESLKI